MTQPESKCGGSAGRPPATGRVTGRRVFGRGGFGVGGAKADAVNPKALGGIQKHISLIERIRGRKIPTAAKL